MKRICLIAAVLITATSAFPEDKIFTNKDLKPQSPSYWNSTNRLPSFIRRSDYNSSFNELNKYIENKLAGNRIPEYKVYLRPLSAGLTEEEVSKIWLGGKIISGSGGHEESEDKTLDISVSSINYEIGVFLYFENNKLKGWGRQNQTRRIIPKNEKVNYYRDLKKEIGLLNEDEEVKMSIRGCQTLQEALDGKPGRTDAEFSVLRHGRTIQEICETVGQGCQSCEEVPQQTVR
jgi:hypothetical protein